MTDSVRYKVAIVGASETTELGTIPNMSNMMLAADAAMNAIKDCGIDKDLIDGVFSTQQPTALAHYLGITPKCVDGTSVGGTSFLLHVRHAAAALALGYCNYALVTMGESGYTRGDSIGIRGAMASMMSAGGGGRGRPMPGGFGAPNNSFSAQFEAPYGPVGPTTLFGMGILRYMKETGLTHEQLAAVPVAHSKWVKGNPRALRPDEVTVQDVLDSRMICYPLHLLECCVVTDGGGALIMTTADRAKDFPKKPVYILGTGESVETPMVSQMEDMTTSKAFRVASKKAFDEAQVTHADIDHVMIYDAFAHLPIYALEDTGFLKRGEAGAFFAEGHTDPGGRLPVNTNGGGLCYTHSGMYGMYLMQEAARQLRGEAFRQVEGIKTSFLQGVGGMFGAAGSMVWTNEPPH
jgi:acetyl-CoA acetyltransferase